MTLIYPWYEGTVIYKRNISRCICPFIQVTYGLWWKINNSKTSQMTYAEKIYIMNEDNNIIRVHSKSIILLIFMSDIFFMYMSNKGWFTFIIHHFVCFMT